METSTPRLVHKWLSGADPKHTPVLLGGSVASLFS